MKTDAIGLLVAGAALFAIGRADGQLEHASRLRAAARGEAIAEASADSLAQFIAHRKCWFDPVPRDFWKGAVHR